MPRKTKQNEITSPELLNQVNPDNVRLKQDFIAYLQSVQRSPKTIAGYSNDIDIFWVWNLQNNGNKFFPKISKRDYAAYQHWLINENGNSPARVRRLKSAISSLSNYVENILDDEDEFKDFRSTVRKIENPAMQQVRKKTVWSDEALDKLLDDLLASGQNKKACAVALAMCSGRRKAELCRFKVDDFKDENLVCGGALYKTSEPIQTKGFGLGKYIYCYTLAKKFKPYFDAWMAERQKLGIECEWLFPAGTTSEQMSDTTLNSWANTFSRMTGEDFYWHSLRHYFTTHLAKLGLPDNVIQDIDTSSDRRLKNNISSDLDRYIPFFMRLQPSVYRFNSGRSGRFHTGFIAQEVEDALRDSGLSTQDFAGLVKCSGLNDAHSKYTDEYSLRYAEFISLNTYMIQRLYRRIDELEQKLQAIEA